MWNLSRNSIIFLVLVIAAVAGGVYFLSNQNDSPGELDGFAVCLKEKGATFYGTFWCPHCISQKKMFGKSADKLPYVECSTPDGKEQLDVCKEKNIQGYPTWEFQDGSRIEGEVSLEVLAQNTGCSLP